MDCEETRVDLRESDPAKVIKMLDKDRFVVSNKL